MIGYLPPLLALVATIVGIRGNTWDGKAPPWRRLTLTGWVACGIAFMSAGLAVKDIRAFEKERRAFDDRNAVVHSIANAQLVAALDDLLRPLSYMVVAQIVPGSPEDLEPEQMSDLPLKNKMAVLDMTASAQFVSGFSSISCYDRPIDSENGEDSTWIVYLQRIAQDCDRRLRDLMSTFRDGLDTTTIQDIHTLLADEEFVLLKRLSRDFAPLGSSHSTNPNCSCSDLLHTKGDEYLTFVDRVKALYLDAAREAAAMSKVHPATGLHP